MLLSSEKELDKIQKKRHLDFLDILLCTKVNVSNNHIKHQRTYPRGTEDASAGSSSPLTGVAGYSFPTPDFQARGKAD